MNTLFLTMLFDLATTVVSAQFIAVTTLNKVEGLESAEPSMTEVYEGDVCPTTSTDDSWNTTDKIGIGYQVNEKLMVGVTMDGEDAYELLGRYDIHEGLWATCIYNHVKDSEEDMADKLDVGMGYSYNVWKGWYLDQNNPMPLKEDGEVNREGYFNLSFPNKF